MSILKTFPFQLSLALKDEHFFRKSLTFLFKYLAYLIVGLIVVKVSYDLIWADTNYFNHLDQKGVNSFQMLRSVIASLFSLVLITILAKYLFDRLYLKAAFFEERKELPLSTVFAESMKLLGEVIIAVPLTKGGLYLTALIFKAYIFIPTFLNAETIDWLKLNQFPLLEGVKNINSIEIPDVIKKDWGFIDYLVNVVDGIWVLGSQVLVAVLVLLFVYFVAEIFALSYEFLKKRVIN